MCRATSESKTVMPERVWYIKQSQLFSRLTDEQPARLERRGRMKVFPKNNTIYMPSDASNGVFLLAEGRVRISSITPDGKQAILAFIEPGELFGELALLESGQREEYAETVVDSTIVLLPGDELTKLMGESAELTLGVTKLIGLRRKRNERRLRSLLFRSNRDRLTSLLLDLVEQYGRTTVEGVLIEIKLSHQDLASIIGATRETVTVLLGEMQLEGLLRVSRQRIVVRNLKRLADGIEAPVPAVAEKRRAVPVRRAAPVVGLDPPNSSEV
jgi:CRP-like cAMP-binding protein